MSNDSIFKTLLVAVSVCVVCSVVVSTAAVYLRPIQDRNKTLDMKKNICVAESLTAGRLQSTIASVAGSSDYFQGGLTAYNLEQKVKLLGIDRNHAAEHNCVSDRVAREMAAGARRQYGSDIAVATTGYAEQSPEHEVAVPHAYYAIDIEGRVITGRVDGPGLNRIEMQSHVAETVMRELVNQLRN